jgi:hypothetical protein
MQSKSLSIKAGFGGFSNLNTKPKILIGICLPLVLLVGLGGVAINSISSIVGTNKQVDHTHNVLSEASSVVASAVDMETGMRGYLLAGDTVPDSFHNTNSINGFRGMFGLNKAII